jgi:hypothetical protein
MSNGIPVTGVLIREGEMTGDGRIFEPGSVRWDSDTLPIPIIFDRQEGDHSGATVGRIESIWRDGSDIKGMGTLSASDDPETQALVARAAELLDEGAVGVSVGADSTRGNVRIDLSAFDDITEEDGFLQVPVAYDQAVRSFTEARLRHLAIVDTPAFATAWLRRDELTGAVVASAAIRPPYFDNPGFGVPGVDDRLRYDPDSGKWSCPPTISGDHFYGHVAPMGLCLRGRADKCVTPPEGDLEGFMRGYAPGANGQRTGVVTLTDRNDHGHSSVGIGAVEATKWYDSVGRGVADVRVGRDAYGIWFSGMVRPGTSKNDRYALAASDVSGHWEMGQRGVPQLCGLPAVNVGGYPKGYLTAAEVASGIAASASVKDATECLRLNNDVVLHSPSNCQCENEPLGELVPYSLRLTDAAGCGCDEAPTTISLEDVLAFHD